MRWKSYEIEMNIETDTAPAASATGATNPWHRHLKSTPLDYYSAKTGWQSVDVWYIKRHFAIGNCVYMSCITGHDTMHLIYARRQCIFRESAGSFECHSIQCVKHCLPWRSFTFGGDAISPNIGGRGGRFIVEVHVKSQVQNHANKRIHPRESSTAVRDDFRESTPRSHARQTKHDSRTSSDDANAIWTAGNIYSSGSQAPTFPNKCKDFIHRLGSHVARHWFPNSDWWAKIL